jgi:hypothetical protein
MTMLRGKSQMPQTTEDQNKRAQQPNWVDVSTLVVLTLTLIAGGILAYLAYRQNDVAQHALELNSRPYISLNLDPRSIVAQSGQKMRINMLLRNSGGIPADMRIRGIITHSVTKLSAPSLDKSAEIRDLIFPKDPNDNLQFIYSPDPITDGQFRDMIAGTGWLYARISTLYGIYSTETCVEYKLFPSVNGKSIYGDFTAINFCDDPKATHAN